MKIKQVYSSWRPKKKVFSWTTTAELSTISKRPCLGDTSAAGLSTSRWACLPDDILALILHKLVYLPDYYRFSCVCKSWNSAAMKHTGSRIQGNNHQLPWLLICSRGDDKDGRGRKRSLYNFMTGTETSNLYLRIPDKYMDKRCCGSSHGWLFFLESRYKLIVMNPISGTVIRLPPLIGRRHYEDGVGKALLSGDPFLGSFEVVATDSSSGVVAHLRFGDKIWSYTRVYWSNVDYSSVALYNGRIFAASGRGKMVSMDITSTNNSPLLMTKGLKIKNPDVVEKTAPDKLDLEEIVPDELDLEDMSSDELDLEDMSLDYSSEDMSSDYSSESSLDSLPDHINPFMPEFGDEDSEEDMCSSDSDDCDDSEDSYSDSSEDLEDKKSIDSFLVETTKGDLLMVRREWEYGGSPTYSIFKFVVSNHDEQVERTIVEDLEGHSLFLGKNHSISVLASDYPGCRSNSIYYAFWDRYSAFPNYGIEEFNLKDQSVRKHVNIAMSLGPDSSKDNRDVCWIVPSIKL